MSNTAKDPAAESPQSHRVKFSIVTLPEGIIRFTATPKLPDQHKNRCQKLWPTPRLPRRVINPREIDDISGMMTRLDVGAPGGNGSRSRISPSGAIPSHTSFDFGNKDSTPGRRRLQARRKGSVRKTQSVKQVEGTAGIVKPTTGNVFGSSVERNKFTSALSQSRDVVHAPMQFESSLLGDSTFTSSFSNNIAASSGNPKNIKKWLGLWRIPFVAPIRHETAISSANKDTVPCRYQCLSSVDDYVNKSLEEMRYEDYLSGRKGTVSLSYNGPKFVALSTSEKAVVRGVPRIFDGKIQCISAMRVYKDKSFEELRVEHYVPSIGWKDRERYSLSLQEIRRLPIAMDSEVYFYADSRKKGKVRFIGRLPGKNPSEIHLGVELDDQSGLGDGQCGGVRLFRTKENCAEFVPLDSALPTYLVGKEDDESSLVPGISKVTQLESIESTSSSSGSENGNKCSVCWTNQVEMFFSPCGHVCCCERCSKPMKNCPICRKRIIQKQRAYLT